MAKEDCDYFPAVLSIKTSGSDFARSVRTSLRPSGDAETQVTFSGDPGSLLAMPPSSGMRQIEKLPEVGFPELLLKNSMYFEPRSQATP